MGVEQACLGQFGLRLQPAMCQYVADRLAAAPASPAGDRAVPVMGCDARTGVAVRMTLSRGDFQGSVPGPLTPAA